MPVWGYQYMPLPIAPNQPFGPKSLSQNRNSRSHSFSDRLSLPRAGKVAAIIMCSRAIRPCFAAGAIVLSAVATQAAQIGSVEEGLTIARERCAACHLVVNENGRSINEKAPTFARIANTPGMTPSALRAALNTSHNTMPNLIIKDDDAESIIAYILSLRDNQ